MADTPIRLLPRSLRARLQLGLAVLLAAGLAGFGVAVYQLLRVSRFSRIDGDLGVRLAALNAGMRTPPSKRAEPPPDGAPPHDQPPPPPPIDDAPDWEAPRPDLAPLFPRGGPYYFVVWYRDGSVARRSPDAPSDTPAPRQEELDTLTHWRDRPGAREVYHCTGFGDCALAGRSLVADQAAMRSLALALWAAGFAVLALGLAAGWWATGRAIRPIGSIGQTATGIAQGDLAARIPVSGAEDELSHLARLLNSTFARLETAFTQQRQFTADAAHELRTPIAVLLAETQSTLARERSPGEYREALEACLETAQQMRRLTESLLELSRLDAGDDAAPRGKAELDRLAAAALEQVRPLAEARGVTLHRELAPAAALANPDRLTQVLLNLLSNAIDYNQPGGEVRVVTARDAGDAVLTVADTGIGIAPEDLPRIFHRFYRADKARSRAAGHTGLGLAICQAIVKAEGGSIDAVSAPGAGSTFTVRLPAARA